jgi:MFS family permease
MPTAVPKSQPDHSITYRQAWGFVFVLLILGAISQLDRLVLSLLVGPISRDLHIADFEMSLLTGLAFGFFYAVFGLPFGILADCWSRRKLIWWGILTWSLATIGCGLAQSYGQLLAARFLVGAGEAALYPAAYSIIADLFPRKRLSFAISVFAMCSAVGAGAALALGGLLIDALRDSHISVPYLGELRPWQLVLILTGSPGLLAGLLIFLFPEPSRTGIHPAKASGLRSLREFVSRRSGFLACHFLGFACIALLAYGMVAWSPTLLMRRFAFSASQAGAAMGVMVPASTISGFLLAGWMIDRMFARGVTDATMRFFLYTTPAAGLIAIAACFMPTAVGYLCCMGLSQICIAVSGPAAAAIQLTTPNRLRGQVSALFIFAFNMIGFGVGPSAVAALTQFIYHDAKLIHLSLATLYAVITPISCLLFAVGLSKMRLAMADEDVLSA